MHNNPVHIQFTFVLSKPKLTQTEAKKKKIISDRWDKAVCINLLQYIAVDVIYLASVLGLSLIKACADSSLTNLGFWMSVLDNCCVILLDCTYNCMNSQEHFVLKFKENNTSEQWIVNQFSVGHWMAEKDHNNAEILINLLKTQGVNKVTHSIVLTYFIKSWESIFDHRCDVLYLRTPNPSFFCLLLLCPHFYFKFIAEAHYEVERISMLHSAKM